MSDINVRSDSVDVEQIMRQIRARIREKRGADYTEAELQQLATVKLEKFLDPRGVRSDLVQQFRKQRTVAPAPPNYEFGETTLYETHRGILATLRRIFKPFLKVLFNPDKLTSALHIQAQVNTQAEQRLRRLEEREPLSYELLHNLTLEITRLGIEVHNLKMRVESLSSRMDFDERRGRSLENVVEYRQRPQGPRSGNPSQNNKPPQALAAVPQAPPPARATTTSTQPAESESPGMRTAAPAPGTSEGAQAGDGERRRRRRRRRRRPGSTMAGAQGTPWAGEGNQGGEPASDAGGDEAGSDDGGDDAPDGGDATES
ncbi:MAG: hypothetical protein ABI634_07700 [Acidobacteriota bacterium]